MAERPPAAGTANDTTAIFDGPFRLVVVLAAILVVLTVVRLVADAGAGPGPAGDPVGGHGAASPTVTVPLDAGAYLLPAPRPAPPLDLSGPSGATVSLAAMRGAPVLVFFGYTHCPDVCPATIGTVGLAIDAFGGGARAIFVSVDPERDTPAWLSEFVRFMPAGFTAATGTPDEVRTVADAWGVRYARVDEGDPDAYTMSHTADVFLVDAAGRLRASFPFGTDAPTMTAVLRAVADDPGSAPPTPTPPTPTPPPSATATASAEPIAIDLWPRVVSSSIWAGGASPVILSLHEAAGDRLDDTRLRVTARLLGPDRAGAGPAVDAVAVQPRGLAEVSFVATLDIPTPGRWMVEVEAVAADGVVRRGVVAVTALDPGGTAALGRPAPAIRTPTAADVGGDLRRVTTDPLPDPRLSATSTADALAAHRPFVLVVDSVRFRITPACGQAVVLARRLVDRWDAVPFIHHEPYRYTVVTSEPVLEGTLEAPRLTAAAEVWGVGAEPWGVASMPWIFIVDGDGVVRATYQGVIGSADVDVLLTMLTSGD